MTHIEVTLLTRSIILGASSLGVLFALSLAPRVPPGTLLASGETPARIERAEPLFASVPWRLSEEPIFSVGAVLGPEHELFGEVAGAVRLSSGAVVVADRQAAEVRFFDGDGALSARAGRRGDGPGEFVLIKSIGRCRGDSLFVFDGRKRFMSTFAPDGRFVRTLDISGLMNDGRIPRSFACNDRGVLVFKQRPAEFPAGREGPHRPSIPIVLRRPDGSRIELGRFPGSERYTLVHTESYSDMPRPLGKRTSVAVGDRRVYVGTGDRFEIVVFSLKGERVGAIRDTVSRVELTPERVEAYIEHAVSRIEGRREREEMREYYAGFEYPERGPAHLELLVGEDGNVWVEQFPLPGEAPRWRVYSPGGERLATVTMPRRFELMAAGEDYVLGVWKERNDVEYVHMYRIIKS